MDGFRMFVGVGVVMVSAVACGTGTPLGGPLLGGSGGTLPGTGTTVDSADCSKLLAYAEAECGREVRCGGTGATSGEACTRSRAGSLNAMAVTKKIDDRTDACAEEMKQPGCGPTPTCEAMQHKQANEAGSACSSSSDCKVGLACIDDICAERHGAGGSCNYTSNDCQDGLSCQGKCASVVSGVTHCLNDDDCSIRRDASPGYDLSSSGGDLAVDFVCDDTAAKCVDVVRGIGSGDACGHGKVCSEGLFCKYTSRDSGTCEVPTKIGDHCTDGDGCPMCVGGVCSDPSKTFCGY